MQGVVVSTVDARGGCSILDATGAVSTAISQFFQDFKVYSAKNQTYSRYRLLGGPKAAGPWPAEPKYS